jgi:amino acid transporter/GNAT superfamily N-acetyltransferase
MIQMCGIGPFITMPAIVSAMQGPPAIAGWIVGALLSMADGLVWAELGAAMPGAGGTYLYLREAFQYRTGKLMPFLFVWTAMLAIPLVMSTGIIGFVQYLGFFRPDMPRWQSQAIGLGVTALAVWALYRRIESIRTLTTALWIVMVLAVGLTMAAAYTRFDPRLAFEAPAGAWAPRAFVGGLGAGLIIAIYDYGGYNTVAYMGDEIEDAGRVMPRAIVLSIAAMMGLYLAMNVGVLGAVPWQAVAQSKSVASLVVVRNWGRGAGVVTMLILAAAFGSVFAGLLAGSRVPFYAARDGLFFASFGRLHPRHDFPHVALLAMGAITAAATFFDLTAVINMLVAVTVLVQSVGQIVALTVLRRRQPRLHRPYRQWLYPVPSIVAAIGWVYVYLSTDRRSQILSTIWIAIGAAAFLVWARLVRAWPFAPVDVREAFMEQPFEIRLANRGDAHALAEAHRDSIQSLGPRYYPPDVVEDWASAVSVEIYPEAMAGGEAFFVAAPAGNPERLLGFSSHGTDGGEHHVGVYVIGAAVRRGVGSALLERAEASARAAGADRLRIDASLAAVDFYKANGFEETGAGEHRLRSGRAMACVFMVKWLAHPHASR